MAWPDEPCPACPRRNLAGCLAQRLRNATLCEHAANGHEGYRALLAKGPEEVARSIEEPSRGGTMMLAGDLIAAMTKRVGADRLARWIEAKTGKPCGCEARRQALNALDAKLRRFLGW